MVGSGGAMVGVGGLGVGGSLMVTESEGGNDGAVGGSVFGFGIAEGREEDGQVVRWGQEVELGYVAMDWLAVMGLEF